MRFRRSEPGSRPSTGKWNADDYARVGGFVAELGGAALDLLDPHAGRADKLDIGCGEGTLTMKIIERGATVLGIDNSPEMVAAARSNGGRCACSSPQRTCSSSPSRTQLFPTPRCTGCCTRSRPPATIFRALKPGARIRRRDGGRGQSWPKLREALDEELIIRGYVPPFEASNWYASPEEFAAVYEAAEFREIDARLIERPTADRSWRRRMGDDLPAKAGSTAPWFPSPNGSRLAPPSPTGSAPTLRITSAFA